MPKRTRPTPRTRCCDKRLHHRDSWNTSEIKIEELIEQYDHDQSGVLEQDEFRELLRDFNNGKPPTDQEFHFILRLADTNRDNAINQGELHYALRAWHSYRHLDDSVVAVFSEFDTDESGKLDVNELKALLTAVNDDVPVPLQEVQWVLDHGSNGSINRSELLGAVAAWYTHVDRKGLNFQAIAREAIVRAALDSNHSQVFEEGAKDLAQATSLLRGVQGYLAVNRNSDPGVANREQQLNRDAGDGSNNFLRAWQAGSPNLRTPTRSQSQASSAPAGEPEVGEHPRCKKVLAFLLSACSKFCYVAFPFLLGLVLATIGWQSRESDCPRNLDSNLLWFGILAIAFSIALYLPNKIWVNHLRIALGVMLIMVDVVSNAWAFDDFVQRHKSECGHFLVWWSMFVWPSLPIGMLVYLLYRFSIHVPQLKNHDDRLQKEILV